MLSKFENLFNEPKKMAVVCGAALALSVVSIGISLTNCSQREMVGVINVSKIMTESIRLKNISNENRLAVDKLFKEAMEKEKTLEGKEKDAFREETMLALRGYKQKNEKECSDVVNAAVDKVAKTQKVKFVVSNKVYFGSNIVDVTDAVLKEIDASGK